MKIEDVRRLLPQGRKRYTWRELHRIKEIVVHHQGDQSMGPDDPDSLNEVVGIAQWHVKGYGWPGIGYHFVIGKKGQIWKTAALSQTTYHTPGYNYSGIGICLMGNMNRYPPTPEQEQALRFLIGEIERGLGRRLRIIGHREVYPTSCPGDHGMRLVEKIRAGRGEPAPRVAEADSVTPSA